MNAKELVTTYFKHDSLMLRPYTMWRHSFGEGNGRMYYSFDFKPQPNGYPLFFISLTTLLDNTLPTPPSLIKWMCDFPGGQAAAKAYAKQRASYGTIMHALYGRLIKHNTLSREDVKMVVFGTLPDNDSEVEYLRSIKAPENVDRNAWVDELWRDCQSFQQFLIEYDVKPMAIEIILGSKDGYATPIDLVCEMNDTQEGFWGEVYKSNSGDNKKGDPKKSKKIVRIIGLINFKSGRKGFHESNEIQLEFERRLFEENYPNIKVDKIFNFAPVDFKTNIPTYKLKDQSDSLEREMFEPLLKIASLKLFKKTQFIKLSGGTMKFKETDPSTLNKSMPLKEWIKLIHEEAPIEQFEPQVELEPNE